MRVSAWESQGRQANVRQRGMGAPGAAVQTSARLRADARDDPARSASAARAVSPAARPTSRSAARVRPSCGNAPGARAASALSRRDRFMRAPLAAPQQPVRPQDLWAGLVRLVLFHQRRGLRERLCRVGGANHCCLGLGQRPADLRHLCRQRVGAQQGERLTGSHQRGIRLPRSRR